MLDKIKFFIDLYIIESSISLSIVSDNSHESTIFLGNDNDTILNLFEERILFFQTRLLKFIE